MISFIISNFNNGKYIEKCINSITKIRNIKYEIIVVDDGSTDSSINILKKIINELGVNKIKVIFLNENLGTFNCRKIGFYNSIYEWVCFVDSDDWINSIFFEKSFFPYFLNKKYDIYLTQLFLNFKSYLDYEVPIWKCWNPPENETNLNKMLNLFYISQWGPPGQCCKIFKKELVDSTYKKIGKISEKIWFAEDQLFMMVYIGCIKNFFSINFPSYFYRQNSNTATTNVRELKQNMFSIYLNQLKIIKKIIKKQISQKNINLGGVKLSKKWIKNQYFNIYQNWININKQIQTYTNKKCIFAIYVKIKKEKYFFAFCFYKLKNCFLDKIRKIIKIFLYIIIKILKILGLLEIIKKRIKKN